MIVIKKQTNDLFIITPESVQLAGLKNYFSLLGRDDIFKYFKTAFNGLNHYFVEKKRPIAHFTKLL